jgi:hypothetical protein
MNNPKEHDEEESSESEIYIVGKTMDLNPIGEKPVDKSSRLLAYHAHALVYRPNNGPFVGVADEEFAARLHPQNLRLQLLRDLGDVVESCAAAIGERVMVKGPRDKALGIQVPYFLVQTEEEPSATPTISYNLLVLLENSELLSDDQETVTLSEYLKGSPLTIDDHNSGMVLEIPGVYDKQTTQYISQLAEIYSTSEPKVQVFSPVPLNAALQMAYWRARAEEGEPAKPAVVFTDHPGIGGNGKVIVVKSAPSQKISLSEMPMPTDRSGETRDGIRVTTMALTKKGSNTNYAAELRRQMQNSGGGRKAD